MIGCGDVVVFLRDTRDSWKYLIAPRRENEFLEMYHPDILRSQYKDILSVMIDSIRQRLPSSWKDLIGVPSRSWEEGFVN